MRASASISVPATCMISILSLAIASWIEWYRSRKCRLSDGKWPELRVVTQFRPSLGIRLVMPLPIPISETRSRSESICKLPYAVAIISGCIIDWATALCFFDFQMRRVTRT